MLSTSGLETVKVILAVQAADGMSLHLGLRLDDHIMHQSMDMS